MGNLFDVGNTVKRRDTGGSSDLEEKLDHVKGVSNAFPLHHYLSKEERHHLQLFFNNHFDAKENRFSESISVHFQKHGANFTSTKLLLHLNFSEIDHHVKLSKFFVDCCRIGSSKSLEMLWTIATASNQQKSLSVDEKILSFTQFVMFLCCPFSEQSSTEALAVQFSDLYLVRLKTICPSYQNGFELDRFLGIVNSYSSQTSRAFHTFILNCFLDGLPVAASSFHPFIPVQLLDETDIIDPTAITMLSLSHPELQGSWKRLYSSNTDGRSFNRIAYSLLGYEGPTCVFIKCGDKDGSIIGAYSAERWRDSNRFYGKTFVLIPTLSFNSTVGSSKNFLFALFPHVRLYKSRVATNGNFQWLNTSSYGMPHGFGYGGTIEAFRLFIPDSFEQADARDSCITYDPGHLTSENKFEIDLIEIWACGGDDMINKGLVAQSDSRAINVKNIEKARKVDKAAFFNNQFDREFLLSNTFAHQKQTERPDVD